MTKRDNRVNEARDLGTNSLGEVILPLPPANARLDWSEFEPEARVIPAALWNRVVNQARDAGALSMDDSGNTYITLGSTIVGPQTPTLPTVLVGKGKGCR